MFKKVHACRVCGNTNLVDLFSLGEQALAGIFPRSRAERVPRAPLDLVKCFSNANEEVCGLVQLGHSFEKSLLYGDHYGYRSGLNGFMARHLQEIVHEISKRIPLRSGDLVIDIGSNDGTLLKAYPDCGLCFFGADPAGEKFRPHYPANMHLVSDFFSASDVRHHFAEKKAKVITSIAMLYDLEEPLEFMREIHDLLDTEGMWVFEQSYLPFMLETGSYDTICHEHLTYYSLKQILWMTNRAGLKIVDLETNAVNGGSLRVTAAKKKADIPEFSHGVENMLKTEAGSGLDELETYDRFRHRFELQRDCLRREVRSMSREGKVVAGYGASTKGNVILQACGFSERDIPFIVDVNQDKWGCWTPGTSIPIVPERETNLPDCYLVLPWSFRSYFLNREKKFLNSGGTFLFPLPEVEKITRQTQVYLAESFQRRD